MKDVIKWEYAMSGVEYENLRSRALHYSYQLTSLMWDNSLVDENRKNEDLSKFRRLAQIDILDEKTKSYDECMDIIIKEFNAILKKYCIERS